MTVLRRRNPSPASSMPATMCPENSGEGVVLRHCLERGMAHEEGMLESMTTANSPLRDSNTKGNEEGRVGVFQ